MDDVAEYVLYHFIGVNALQVISIEDDFSEGQYDTNDLSPSDFHTGCLDGNGV